MRIKINIFLILGFFIFVNILLFGVIFYLAQVSNENRIVNIDVSSKLSDVPFLEEDLNALSVNSRAFVIYEPESRTIVAGNNEFLRFTPASSIKIMTATIALEEYPLNKIIQASELSSVIGSSMDLEEGELITVENLLYGLLLPSGNDAAYILASGYVGGYDAFVARMNKKAEEIGLSNTFFIDPAGFDDQNYSTAFDMARLASHAMRNEKFAEIVSTREKIVTNTSGDIIHDLYNLNELLAFDSVIGIKTGFTEEAGGVLVTAVKSNNRTFIIVVLNSPDRFADTREILINAIENIKLVAY